MTSTVREHVWVFVADPPLIDNAIYSMWVDGFSEQLVTVSIQNSYQMVGSDQILKHVQDQFRLFEELRKYLVSPWLFDKHQSMFHVDGQLRSELLERYYEFEPQVVREFLGKRFNDKLRLSLADIAEKTGVSFRSVLRQFENIKRIYKFIVRHSSSASSNLQGSEGTGISEENEHSSEFLETDNEASDSAAQSSNTLNSTPPSSSIHMVQMSTHSRGLLSDLIREFQIPKRTARKYCRIIYTSLHSLELNKKKFSYLKYKDIDSVISYMIKYWSVLPEESPLRQSSDSPALPKHPHSSSHDFHPNLYPHQKLVSRLSQIRTLVTGSKEGINKIVDEVAQKLGDWTSDSELASSPPDQIRQQKAHNLVDYKLIKSVFVIGASLGQPKDFKKILLDIQEKWIEPCKKYNLTLEETTELLRLVQIEGTSLLANNVLTEAKTRTRKHLVDAYNAFFFGFRECVLFMYEKCPEKS